MRLAEVVVDLRSFRFDEPLTYLVPDKLSERALVGSVVRVPLRQRRVRGWIVDLRDGDDPRAVPVAAISGRGPVFDRPLLNALRKMARRYVAPVSYFLSLVTPARLGRAAAQSFPGSAPSSEPAPGPVVWRLGPNEDPTGEYAGMIQQTLQRGRGALVLVPEVREGSRVLDKLQAKFETQAALVHSGLSPAQRSASLWEVAAGNKKVVLGSRAAALAPAFPLGLVIVHAEHDPSFKDQRAPYYDARWVALARAEEVGAEVYLVSPTPSISTFDAKRNWKLREPARPAERAAWPAVEIVEPPRGLLSRRAIAAIIETKKRGERTIVLLPRAATTPTGPGSERIAEYVGRVVPSATVARADRPALGAEPGALREALDADVLVATEAALAEIERPPVATAIALDADVLLERPKGRATEDAFETLWSLASLVAGRTPRGRVVVETNSPTHHVVQALTRGDYHYFADRELESREKSNSPPLVSLIRVRAGELPAEAVEAMRRLEGTEVLGPVPADRGMEALLKVENLEAVLDPLREIVAAADRRILVEVDPADW